MVGFLVGRVLGLLLDELNCFLGHNTEDALCIQSVNTFQQMEEWLYSTAQPLLRIVVMNALEVICGIGMCPTCVCHDRRLATRMPI